MHLLSLLIVPALFCLSAAQDSVDTKTDGVLKEASRILPRGDSVENKIRAPFVCPREDFVSGKCDKQNGCVYPDPKNCRNYFICEWKDGGKMASITHTSCPRSGDGYLEWNNKDKKCDSRENSTCKEDNGVDTMVHGVLDGAMKNLPRDDGVENKIRASFVCPREDFVSGKCDKQNGCMYPDPNNCRNYFHCKWNADGKTTAITYKSCPKSASGYLEWNDKEKRCDSRENSTCPGVSTMFDGFLREANNILPRSDAAENQIRDAAPFKCPMSDIVITQCRDAKDCVYPNPGSCNTFIQCSVGSSILSIAPTVKSCLPGHEWNDKEKKCDVPEKSTCPMHANGEKKTGDDHPPNEAVCTGPNCSETPINDLVNSLGDGINKAGLKSHGGEKKIRAPDSKDELSCTGAGCPGTVIDGVANGVEDVLRQAKDNSGKKSVHTRAAFTCPTKDIIKTKCKGPRDCRYPDPESCSHFYLCFVSSDGKTGTPHNYACGEGLLWNDKLKSCDWPASSTCKL